MNSYQHLIVNQKHKQFSFSCIINLDLFVIFLDNLN